MLAGVCLAAGCGSGSDRRSPIDSIVAEGESGCSWPLAHSHVELGNSGLRCEEAFGISVILSAGARGPQTVHSGKDVWTCRAYPSWERDREVRCRTGRREFRLERTG
jgi:hypothetical protein